MTVEELRRAVENHLGPESRLQAFLSIAALTLSRIRAFGDTRNGWSFDFTKSAFNTQAAYSTGTVAISQSSTAVVGTGTTWTGITLDRHKLRIGGIDYPITTITDNTNIVLTEAFAGTTVTAAEYSIVKDEFVLPQITHMHSVWDATNDRKLRGIARSQMGDLAVHDAVAERSLCYCLLGRGTLNVPIMQIQPSPLTITRIEYWYQADYTRIADIGDSIDLPIMMDAVLIQGAIARASQVLRRDGWRDEQKLFEDMVLEAWYADKPQRESVVRMMRTDRLELSNIDLPAWHEVSV